MSASSRKRTSGQTSQHVRFVPNVTECSAAKSALIRSPRRRGQIRSAELRCIAGGIGPAVATRHVLMPLELLDADQYAGRSLHLSVSEVEVPLRGKTMPTEHKSGTGSSAHRVEISHLVHVYGVTRDQARRLLSKIGNDRAKLGEAARILKARLPSRSVPEAK